MASSSSTGSIPRPDPTTVLPDVGSGVAVAARAGYTAKGIVYVLVGGLTASAALGSGDTTTPSEVVRGLPGTWWGATMLVLIAVGLAGYVVWQIVRAVADPEDRGTDAKGLALRASYLFSAAVYGLLGFTAVKVLLDQASSSSGSSSTSRDHHRTAAAPSPADSATPARARNSSRRVRSTLARSGRAQSA